MDHRDNNIFYGLVENENSATEIFCNFFKYKLFMRAILELFLEKELIDRIEFEHCDTQIRFDGCGQPDLIISNKEVEIIFEVKVGNRVDLTDNQPVGYLNRFNDNEIEKKKHKWLIFLIPDDYIREYKEKWGERMEINAEQWVKREPIPVPNHYGVKTHKLYWSQIIRKIEEYDLSQMNRLFDDYLAILKMSFQREPIKFTSEEVELMFSDKIPEAIIKLFKIVGYVREDLIKSELGHKIYVPRMSMTSEECGIYIRNQNDLKILYFGVWYQFWKKYGKPLCYGVGVGDRRVLDAFKQSHQGKIQDENSFSCSWVDMDTIKKENCEKEISSLIVKEVSDILTLIES